MSRPKLAFLLDVDNTLLDNDRFEHNLQAWLERAIGPDSAALYWQTFEALRRKLDHADFLGALARCWEDDARDPRWLPAGDFLLDYPFRDLVYPGTFDVLARLADAGPIWLVSDGDGIMQPRKLRRAGLWDVASGVLIYIHKERRLADIAQRCPAAHHVLVDDKLRVLHAVKQQWQEQVTTVLPQQGRYAADQTDARQFAAPDITIARIAELADNPRLLDLLPKR